MAVIEKGDISSTVTLIIMVKYSHLHVLMIPTYVHCPSWEWDHKFLLYFFMRKWKIGQLSINVSAALALDSNRCIAEGEKHHSSLWSARAPTTFLESSQWGPNLMEKQRGWLEANAQQASSLWCCIGWFHRHGLDKPDPMLSAEKGCKSRHVCETGPLSIRRVHHLYYYSLHTRCAQVLLWYLCFTSVLCKCMFLT